MAALPKIEDPKNLMKVCSNGSLNRLRKVVFAHVDSKAEDRNHAPPTITIIVVKQEFKQITLELKMNR